jgi:hypothetical protein
MALPLPLNLSTYNKLKERVMRKEGKSVWKNMKLRINTVLLPALNIYSAMRMRDGEDASGKTVRRI